MNFNKPWGNYLLEKLVETPAPQSIDFWPQTLAWQLIFSLLLLLGLKKCYQVWRQYQANSYRREALAWLAQCSLSNEAHIRQLPTLLRKTALLANKLTKQNDNKLLRDTAMSRHQQITALTGQDWATWLDKHCANCQFSQQGNNYTCAQLLAELAYIPNLPLNDSHFTSALNELCQQITLWLKYHQLTALTAKELAKNSGHTLGEQHD